MKKQSATDKKLKKLTYSVQQAADVIGCSLPIMYQLCSRPGFPALRISEKRIVIPRAALEIWLVEETQARAVR